MRRQHRYPYNMLRAFREGMQAQVMIDGEMTDAFPVAHGVKQGCVLASTLFTLFLAAVLEVSNRDTTKGVYIQTRSEGRILSVSRLKAKTKVRQLSVRDLLHADDTGFVSHSEVVLQKILDRFAAAFASFELSISVRGLRYCIKPLPGHRIQHRRSCSMVRHLTSPPPLNTLGAPSQTTAASIKNCRYAEHQGNASKPATYLDRPRCTD